MVFRYAIFLIFILTSHNLITDVESLSTFKLQNTSWFLSNDHFYFLIHAEYELIALSKRYNNYYTIWK